MKNILGYYYGLHPEEISYKDNKYFFEYRDRKYVFEPFERPLGDIECLYKITIAEIKAHMGLNVKRYG